MDPRHLGLATVHPYIRELAAALSLRLQGKLVKPPRLAVWMILPRNLLFLIIVITHGFLRLIPRKH